MPAISLPIPGLLPTELSAGDRLTQPEFHAIYETMPKHIRAELIAGVVYMASPMKRRHGRNQFPLGAVLQSYESSTPGVEAGAGTTFILDPLSEPQPDACLYILPECGGQVVENSSGYFEGAPEFVCEVSDSTRGVDLTGKLEEYRRCGVREYVVLICVTTEFTGSTSQPMKNWLRTTLDSSDQSSAQGYGFTQRHCCDGI